MRASRLSRRGGSRSAAALVAVALVTAALVAGCSSETRSESAGSAPAPVGGATGVGGTAGVGGTTGVGGAGAKHGCLKANDPGASVAGGYGVGRITVTFTDRSRPTNADATRHLARKPFRSIPVVISYPTPRTGFSPGSGPASSGATPRPTPTPTPRPRPRPIPTPAATGVPAASGSFPLVILSHGVHGDGTTMAALAEPFVRAGYVVATPTFPLSNGPTGNIFDLPNQPADVGFVITSVTSFAARAGTPVSGHVATGCVAIAGHSLGAATTLAAAYLSCCRDRRVRAVVSMSGVLAPFRGTFDGAPPVPLLLLHGDQDATVPVVDSRKAFDALHGPRYFVTLHGATHNSIFAPPAAAVLNHAVVSFLDDYLKGDDARLRALPSYLRGSGAASLVTAS